MKINCILCNPEKEYKQNKNGVYVFSCSICGQYGLDTETYHAIKNYLAVMKHVIYVFLSNIKATDKKNIKRTDIDTAYIMATMPKY